MKRMSHLALVAAAIGFMSAAPAFAAATLDVKDAWYGVKNSAECHNFTNRLVRCNGDASCKFSCDSTSKCGDPAPGQPKSCGVTYTCSDKPDAKVQKSFPEATTPQELACGM